MVNWKNARHEHQIKSPPASVHGFAKSYIFTFNMHLIMMNLSKQKWKVELGFMFSLEHEGVASNFMLLLSPWEHSQSRFDSSFKTLAKT